jgi:rRNA maturation endonuclease Nob1
VDKTEAARFLGSLPKQKRYARTCSVCGKAFQATARGKFCTAICRARDQTKRKTEARRTR